MNHLLSQLQQYVEELECIQAEEKRLQRKIAELMIQALNEAKSASRSEDEELMSIKDCAAFLGVSAGYMYKNSRRIPHILMGDKPMYLKSQVIAWVKQNQIQPISEEARGRPRKFRLHRGGKGS